MFQVNTNASLKNLDTHLGHLGLSMQNQSRDSFLSDTKKNPKDNMAITLRSGRGLQKRKKEEEKENEITKKKDKEEIGKESQQNSSKLIEERRKSMVQQE